MRGRADLRTLAHTRSFAALLLAAAAAASPAQAQEHDAQLWVGLDAEVELRDAVGLELQTNQRFSDESGGLYESQYLAALSFDVADGVTLTGGLNYVVAYEGGDVDTTEWRPRQQLSFPLGKLGSGRLTGRVRAEQRFQSDTDKVGHRLRPEVAYVLPIRGDVELRLAHESYLNLNETDYQDTGHERMRNSAALRFPLTGEVDAEVGFLAQHRFNGDDEDLIEHVLNTRLSFSF